MDRARRWRRSTSAVMAIVAVAVATARSWNFAASFSQRFFTVLCVADITFRISTVRTARDVSPYGTSAATVIQPDY